MKFEDFKNNPQELIGKTVLHESGMAYSQNISRRLDKIVKVTKTGFKISTISDKLFNLYDGRQKGLNGRMYMATISKCALVTEEQADEIRKKWALKREEMELREKMEQKLNTMTLEQLKQMDSIK